jgi:nucleoside-diphosphate-sugar epimerase
LDKASIYGVYGFTGFHLCKRLLEKGFSIEGIHVGTDRDLFLEEKRLEIGRNANFEEITFEDLQGDNDPEVTIISLYDWFMTDHESKAANKQSFLQIVQSIKEKKSLLSLILPIQLLTDLRDLDGMEEVRSFLKQAELMGDRIQYFYLPTIFGPLQPSSFLFQRKLQEQFITEQLEIREWPFDAIFIDDALDPIIERMEAGEPGSFLLESGNSESWEQCAKFLDIEESMRSDFEHAAIQKKDGLEKIVLQKVTPFEKALLKQKEHLSYVLDIQEHS